MPFTYGAMLAGTSGAVVLDSATRPEARRTFRTAT